MPRHTLQPVVRSVHARRVSRTLLAGTGLLLAAGGGLGLALGFGAFGSQRAQEPVLSDSTRLYAQQHGWYWFAVAGAAAAIALTALWWLLVQLRSSDAAGTLRLEPDDTGGATLLAPEAVEQAVATEARSYLGVSAARARVSGSDVPVDLVLVTTLDGRRPVGELRERLEDGAVHHARCALETPDLPVRLELHLAPVKAGGGRRQQRPLSELAVQEAAERDASGVPAPEPGDATLPREPSGGDGVREAGPSLVKE